MEQGPVMVQSPGGAWSPAVGGVGDLRPAPAPEGGWTRRQYAAVILLLVLVGGALVGFGLLVGQPATLGLIGALPCALVILLKPEIGLYLLALYVPFETFAVVGPTATLTKFLGIYTLIVLLPHLLARRRIRLGPAFLFAGGFTLWSLLTVIAANSPELARHRLFTRVQMTGLLFLALTACDTKQKVYMFYWALFLGSVLAAGAAFFMTPEELRTAQIARATVGEQNVNSHAKDLLPGVFLAPILLMRSRRWLRLLVVLGLLLVLVGLVRTGSRSNYIGVFAGILGGVLVFRTVPLPRRVGYAVGAAVGVGLFVLVGTVTGLWAGGLGDRLINLWQHGLEEGGRLWRWGHAFRIGAEHPLLGVGIGNYAMEALTFGAANVTEAGVVKGSAHNDVLAHFAETGLPGLILYLGFAIAALVAVLRIRDVALRSGLVGLFVATHLASLANPSAYLKSFWLQSAAIILGGLAFAASRTSARRDHHATPGERLPPRPTSEHLVVAGR